MIKNAIRLFSICLILSVAAASCTMPSTDTVSDTTVTLEGYWKSPGTYGDGFEISNGKFYQYDNSSKTVSFAGNIVNKPDLKKSGGYILVRITDPGTWSYTPDFFTVIGLQGRMGLRIYGSVCHRSLGGRS
jgi:hypothetical protein